MMYEYALEPEMVSKWGKSPQCRFYFREFDKNQGRLVSYYPKKWAKKVLDSFNGNDIELKRLVEMLELFKQRSVKRNEYLWDTDSTWINNVIKEHRNNSFDGILVEDNPSNIPGIINEKELDDGYTEGWDIPSGKSIRREPKEMAESVKNILTYCKWVKFIDPYIDPFRPKYEATLKEFFKVLINKKTGKSVLDAQVHTFYKGQTDNRIGRENYLEKYQSILPAGVKLKVFFWENKNDNKKMHNRYILTNHVGVTFLNGLDAGEKGEKDNVNRLDYNQYLELCNDFQTDAQTFHKASEPLEVIGANEIDI